MIDRHRRTTVFNSTTTQASVTPVTPVFKCVIRPGRRRGSIRPNRVLQSFPGIQKSPRSCGLTCNAARLAA